MIQSFSIKNYRGFNAYSIEHLAQVNLFVGKNNVGKTSLLEAIQICESPSPISELHDIGLRRNETSIGRADREMSTALVDINHAFSGHRIGLESTVEFGEIGRSTLHLRIFDPTDVKQPRIFFRPSGAFGGSLSSFGGNMPSNEFTYLVIATRDGELVEGGKLLDEGFLFATSHGSLFSKAHPDRERPLFMPSVGFSGRTLAALYDKVILGAEEGRLVMALQLLDPLVTGVYFLARAGQTVSRDNVGIVIGRNGSERIPIGSMGEGKQRLLAIAMALVNARQRILLIDEIDTALHYTLMSDLWKLVVESAEALEVQTFATSHSLDCIRGLHQFLEQQPHLAEKVAVHKVDGRLDFAVTLTGEKLLDALKFDLELR